jgi:hypothetical protein
MRADLIFFDIGHFVSIWAFPERREATFAKWFEIEH